MKTIKFFGVLLLAGATVVSSCKKDEEDKIPNIAVTGGMAEAAPGEEVTFKVTVGSEENNISKLEILSSVNGSTAGKIWDTMFSNSTNTSIDYVYTVSTAQKDDDKIELTFKVTDSKDLTNSSKQTITVKFSAGPINNYTAKLLGGAANPNAGSFFDASSGTVMFTAQADASPGDVDLVYQYSNTNFHLIAAPDDANISQAHASIATWATKNATRFKTTSITKAEFEAVEDDGLIVAQATGSNQTRVNNLVADQVFAFMTVDGKYGLAHVVSTGGATPDTRNTIINVKVQK